MLAKYSSNKLDKHCQIGIWGVSFDLPEPKRCRALIKKFRGPENIALTNIVFNSSELVQEFCSWCFDIHQSKVHTGYPVFELLFVVSIELFRLNWAFYLIILFVLEDMEPVNIKRLTYHPYLPPATFETYFRRLSDTLNSLAATFGYTMWIEALIADAETIPNSFAVTQCQKLQVLFTTASLQIQEFYRYHRIWVSLLVTVRSTEQSSIPGPRFFR